MDNQDFTILSSNSNISYLQLDYDNYSKKPNKLLKIGLVGTMLLCTNPSIYIREAEFNVRSDVHHQSINSAKNYSIYFDNYINELSNIDKVNFTINEIITTILSFKSLNSSWDGYGALPLEIKSASNAIEILNNIETKLVNRVDDFYPNTHGTISFEWTNKLQEKLFLEIGNESFSYFVKYKNSAPLFFNDLDLNGENFKNLSKHIKSI